MVVEGSAVGDPALRTWVSTLLAATVAAAAPARGAPRCGRFPRRPSRRGPHHRARDLGGRRSSMRLWEHRDRCALHWFPGAHVWHVSQLDYLRRMTAFLQTVMF